MGTYTITPSFSSLRLWLYGGVSALCLSATMFSPAIASDVGDYLAAQHARNTGDVEEAARRLDRLMETQTPNNLPLLTEAYSTLVMAGRIDEAAALANHAIVAGDDSTIAKIILAVQSAKQGDFKRALEQMEDAPETGFSRILLPVMRAWLLQGQGQEDKAFTTIQVAESVGVFAPLIHYQSALLHDVCGELDKAVDTLALYRSSGGNANSERMLTILANIYSRAGEEQELNTLFQQFSEHGSTMWFEEDELLDFIRMPLKRTPVTPIIRQATDGIAEAFYSVAAITQFQDRAAETLAFIQLALYLRPDFDHARLLLAGIYTDNERLEEANKVLKEVTHSPIAVWKAKLQIARNLYALGEERQAIHMLKQLAKSHPESHAPWLHMADMLRMQKEYRPAATYYSTALKHISASSSAHWPIYYARGISYERTGQWEKAERDFMKALELVPDQPDVLNYLAYSWLEKGIQQQKARDMLERAVSVRPDDPHIIDSLGWAEFKLQNYEKAAFALEQAVELLPHDPVVNDHLGDVYWALGRKTEARYQWQRALLFDPDDELEAAIFDKLEHGLNLDAPAAVIEAATEPADSRL